MRILITGINGFVGKHLFHFLKEKKHEVYGIYRSGIPFSENCYQADLTNQEETKSLFDVSLNNKIDVVIHTASVMANSNNLIDLSVIHYNTVMAKNIANAIKSSNTKQLINFSSSSVYPNIDGSFSETSELNPSKNSDCFYGISKLNSELIFDYFLNNSSIKTLHLRIAMIYGKGMNETRLIPVLENELAKTNTLTLYANGERYINQIHIDKLCGYVELFLLNREHGVFNVGDEFISTKEIAENILKQKGNKSSKIVLKQEGNKNKFQLNISKLQNFLSVQAS